jgi:hypothetical protein
VAHDNAGMARAAIELMYAKPGANAVSGTGTGTAAEQVKQGKKAS